MPSSVSSWYSKQKYATQKKYTGLHKPVLEIMIFFFKKKKERTEFQHPTSDLIHDEIMWIAVLL